MENLIELDALYHQHLPSAVPQDRPSPAAPASTSRATHAPSRPAAGPSKPAVNPSEPCEKFNLGKCSRPGCPRAHVCLSCRSADHGLVTCNAGGKTRPRTGGNPPQPIPPARQPPIGTSASAQAADAASAPQPQPRLIPPPPRPNTTCALPVFDPADSPATLGSLRAERWEPLLALYPDPEYRAQLGYADDGPLRTATRLDVGNLPMDDEDRVHVRREIAARLAEGRLRLVLNPEAERLVCSPLGVVPKPNSDKRRTIYHLLWKADLEDAFRHVITCLADARLMGISFDGEHYKECALAFGGKSSPWLFNLLAEFLHWLAELLLQPKAHVASPVSHYLDDFFGATAAGTDPFRPVALLSLAAEALGFKISAKKTFWNRTRLEVLGVDVDSVAQTASVTPERRARLIALCERMLARGRASLLELQRVAGHLQFVTRPSPFVVEHVWTDASKRLIGGHCGLAERPSAVFSHELPRKHRSKDIRFLEALAVLEALRRFSPAWGGPRRVMLYVDNENVEYGLRKGSSRDPLTQSLFRAIFALCLERKIDLHPVRVASEVNLSRPPSGFASTVGLSPAAASLLWNGLAASTRSRASGTCAAFAAFAARAFRASEPFPATERMLAEWVADHTATGKTYSALKRNLGTLRSWHVDLGISTAAFDGGQLERVVRGFKRTFGVPPPKPKLPITLLLLRRMLLALPTVCTSHRNRAVFCAAFCLAFACFLRAGEITCTCAVAALRALGPLDPAGPLFALEGGRPFDRAVFVDMLRRCLTRSGVAAAAYAGHSFRRGAATWAAHCGADADTIRGLGRWRSDCFRRYVDRAPAERRATAAAALYSTLDGPLALDGAWRDL
ncbi:uncharacterized protein PSFLO_07759 [Pseudozyma flocculosa]|uniref:C3H1-type domain-containing protein n=1 Tax=Pseudozyma flocculosa TaxID=84751 RepID=A0A5C3FDU2_9BASI|nr:uncharacterized protein PSFLO_07759 [Pseudozyma flocculosa]